MSPAILGVCLSFRQSGCAATLHQIAFHAGRLNSQLVDLVLAFLCRRRLQRFLKGGFVMRIEQGSMTQQMGRWKIFGANASVIYVNRKVEASSCPHDPLTLRMSQSLEPSRKCFDKKPAAGDLINDSTGSILKSHS